MRISKNLLICTNQIISGIHADKNFIIQNPNLMDALIFINIRLITPFILNVQAFSDPLYRLSRDAYKLDKNLKQLFNVYYEPFRLDYTNYFKFLASE